MALYSDSVALHSSWCSRSWSSYGRACSCSLRDKPYRYCERVVRTCSSHSDPCSLSYVDFWSLFSVVHAGEFWQVRGYRSVEWLATSSLGSAARTVAGAVSTTTGLDSTMSVVLCSAQCGAGVRMWLASHLSYHDLAVGDVTERSRALQWEKDTSEAEAFPNLPEVLGSGRASRGVAWSCLRPGWVSGEVSDRFSLSNLLLFCSKRENEVLSSTLGTLGYGTRHIECKMQNINYFKIMKYKMLKFSGLC
jgi:hypothetical protein